MTETTYSMTVPTDEPTIVVRRFVAAPPALVWRAWTEPDLFARWIGPRYLTNTVMEMDVRVGGRYRFVQTAPDGGTHAFHGDYLEVDPPRRLVSTFVYEPFPDAWATDTLELEEVEGGTLLHISSRHVSFETRDSHLAAGMEAGMTEGFERLDDLISEGGLA
jgi:uncharacterized protein YndB with AHSA1/START domain